MRDDGRFVFGTLAWAAAVLVVAFLSPGYVDGQCVSQPCSDDPFPLGNERICWDAATGATTYDVAADGTACFSVIAPETCTDLPGSCRGDAVRVRACNQAGCSEWSGPVEILPFACLRGLRQHSGVEPRDNWTESCEEPCWVGGPRRLPNIPECPP